MHILQINSWKHYTTELNLLFLKRQSSVPFSFPSFCQSTTNFTQWESYGSHFLRCGFQWLHHFFPSRLGFEWKGANGRRDRTRLVVFREMVASCEIWNLLPPCNFTIIFLAPVIVQIKPWFGPMVVKHPALNIFFFLQGLILAQYYHYCKHKQNRCAGFHCTPKAINFYSWVRLNLRTCVTCRLRQRKDMRGARSCSCGSVRAHLTACPCLRGSLLSISNMSMGKCLVHVLHREGGGKRDRSGSEDIPGAD